jgi:hypothetical protein
VWTDRHCHTWLILDQREGKRDKVYTIAGDEDVLRGDDGDDLSGLVRMAERVVEVD